MIIPFVESVESFITIWFLLPFPIRAFADVVLIIGLALGVMKIFLRYT